MVLQHADYTVGWICSTPTDLTPATWMLDERHPDLPFIAGDPNIYILGLVAGHNVVITCLSHTTHGLSSSADVAKNLMRSFPGVRNSLLVGVGGGVPSSTVDIRLGDVVVSTPNKVDSGVMQCKVPEGKVPVEIIGWLERPPHALLGAANKVREKRGKPRRHMAHIKKAILRYPEVKEHSTFPGRKQDLLFQSRYNHHEGDRCNNCSPSEIIERAPRNSTDPITHYGSIASVDIVVRNTSLLDRMYQISGVIGIDMEAAGLKHDFPCMMIRGIANYSDSHSNTKFQKYAAMTAAAYAKELLASLDATSTQNVTIAADEVSVDKIIVEIAQILASNPGVDELFKMSLLRLDMTPQVFLRHLAAGLYNLGGDMIESTKGGVKPATGWILKRYKQAIATKIYELLQPPDIERQQQPLSAFRKNKPSQDPEEDEPDLAGLANLRQWKRYLFKGAYFDEFLKQLKNSLFPTPVELIKRVLRQHMHHLSQSSSISCVINWQFLEYCDSEGITSDDIELIFTLTGEFDRSCATTLGGYMEGKWKTGKSLLDGIKRSLTRYLRKDANEPEIEIIADDESQTEIRLFPKSADIEERAIVTISGTFDRIAERLEQFAWLTATLRLYEEDQLTVSDIDFKAHQTNIGGPVFHISLYSQEKAFRPNRDAPGQCWTSVFTSSVLAHGFSLCGTDRPKDMLGLELPFDIMLRFTGVVCPVFYNRRLAFTSDSSILIPKVISGDSIQWHFQEIKTLPRRDPNTSIPDPPPEALDIESLANARAFLGYSSNSEVLLGTADFADIEITRSQVSRTESFLEIKCESLLEMGFNKYLTGKVQVACRGSAVKTLFTERNISI